MDLSLIIACYNEAEHLEKSFSVLMDFLKKSGISFEIIIVEDKSRDKTLLIIKKLLKQFKSHKISLITHVKNQGRGKSIADGMRVARGNIVGYLDVDLEIGPEYIPDALQKIKRYDVVVGNRSYKFSIKTIHRYIASKGYVFLVKNILHLPISDTESGFKFFNRKKILPILDKATNQGWFWDTEIVAYSYWSGLRVCEIPVVYTRLLNKKSTVHTISDSINYFINLCKLYMKSE